MHKEYIVLLMSNSQWVVASPVTTLKQAMIIVANYTAQGEQVEIHKLNFVDISIADNPYIK